MWTTIESPKQFSSKKPEKSSPRTSEIPALTTSKQSSVSFEKIPSTNIDTSQNRMVAKQTKASKRPKVYQRSENNDPHAFWKDSWRALFKRFNG